MEKNGKVIEDDSEGVYLNGKRWKGKGKEYGEDSEIFDGEYLNGEKWNGKEKEYSKDDFVLETEYVNGERFILY